MVRTRSLPLVLTAWACLVVAGGAGPSVSFRPARDSLRMEIAEKPVATYVYRDETINRPYFAQVRSLGGVQVTRNHPPVAGRDPVDHATMHPGVWLAFGDLGGADDWRNRAKVVHERFVAEPAGGPGRGTFAVSNRYIAADGTTLICTETCRYTVVARPAGYFLIAASEFRSESTGFHFGDQEEMGFGLRVATPLAVKQGGRLVNSDGLESERNVWGKPADWCDYSGTIDGRRVGVTLIPDPGNFRRSWFHARDYGLLVANPFGRKAFNQGETSRVSVRAGEPFRLGFAVFVHDTAADELLDLAAIYQDYRRESGSR